MVKPGRWDLQSGPNGLVLITDIKVQIAVKVPLVPLLSAAVPPYRSCWIGRWSRPQAPMCPQAVRVPPGSLAVTRKSEQTPPTVKLSCRTLIFAFRPGVSVDIFKFRVNTVLYAALRSVSCR